MINDPLAYFITFHTYGSWLHGDEKRSVDKGHNVYEMEYVRANENRRIYEQGQQNSSAKKFQRAARIIIDKTINEVAKYRGWTLHALNVRTNHIHVVVSANTTPEKVMNDFKVYCTRRLRETGEISKEEKIWSRHGSTRYLWDEKSVEEACRYVVEEQGVDLT